MSGCVALCLPSPEAVVAWFVTGSMISLRNAGWLFSANPQARHHHGAMTGEPDTATVICERAPPLPVKSVDPPLAASVWSSVADQLVSRFIAPWDRKPDSPSGSLSAWPLPSAAARAGARRADPRLLGRHRPGMAGIPHVRHASGCSATPTTWSGSPPPTYPPRPCAMRNPPVSILLDWWPPGRLGVSPSGYRSGSART